MPTKEQIAFCIAEPHRKVKEMSAMDLYEIGGELLSVRRREANKLKRDEVDKESAKKLVVRSESLAESSWKKRLLHILQLLAQSESPSTYAASG